MCGEEGNAVDEPMTIIRGTLDVVQETGLDVSRDLFGSVPKVKQYDRKSPSNIITTGIRITGSVVDDSSVAPNTSLSSISPPPSSRQSPSSRRSSHSTSSTTTSNGRTREVSGPSQRRTARMNSNDGGSGTFTTVLPCPGNAFGLSFGILDLGESKDSTRIPRERTNSNGSETSSAGSFASMSATMEGASHATLDGPTPRQAYLKSQSFSLDQLLTSYKIQSQSRAAPIHSKRSPSLRSQISPPPSPLPMPPSPTAPTINHKVSPSFTAAHLEVLEVRSRHPIHEALHSRAEDITSRNQDLQYFARAQLQRNKTLPSKPTNPTPTPGDYLHLPKTPPLPALPFPHTPVDNSPNRSIYSNFSSPNSTSTTPSTIFPPEVEEHSIASERELAKLLASPRLTRLVKLQNYPNEGMTVSLSDVGCATGHPVLVFLGLGCVRYLVALYDELASALNLRLIAIDRWGLGKTSEVPDSKRGVEEWSKIVEEVASQLSLTQYSILAHSAGGLYALGSAQRFSGRVKGSIHLLAPISSSGDSLAGAFKLLKYVPSSVLRKVQAGEWKLQAWRLGKLPTIVHDPIGFDCKAAVSSSDSEVGKEAESESRTSEDGREIGSETDGSLSEVSMIAYPSPLRQYPSGRVVVNGKVIKVANKTLMAGIFGGSDSSRGKATSPLGSKMKRSISSQSDNLLSPPESPRSPRRSFSSPPTSSPSTHSNLSSSGTLGSNSSLSSLTSTTLSGSDLVNGILRASHFESLSGSTSDLITILDRHSSKSSCIRFSDIRNPVKIWIGSKDDRISLESVRVLEVNFKDCKVEVVDGANHSLMTSKRFFHTTVLQKSANPA